jgi:GxxExxY protein
VHKTLGKGFSKIVYKDALEFEFSENKIPFEREKEFSVNYKSTTLKHKFYADFVLYNSIILEVKTVDCFNNSHYNQCLNYLKVSDNELALLVNFNSVSLEYKRIVRTKK